MTVVFEPEGDAHKRPVLEHMSRESPKTIILFKRSLRSENNNSYVVDIVQAVDPTKQGLHYFLDLVEEEPMTSGGRGFINRVLPMTQKKINKENLFEIGIDDGVVKAVKPRSHYKAKSYTLKLRVASAKNESLSTSGYLAINLDYTKDSMFTSNVYMINLDENQQEIKHVFGMLTWS